jgi:hypothetical protein
MVHVNFSGISAAEALDPDYIIPRARQRVLLPPPPFSPFQKYHAIYLKNVPKTEGCYLAETGCSFCDQLRLWMKQTRT